jgi:hypothetical protein
MAPLCTRLASGAAPATAIDPREGERFRRRQAERKAGSGASLHQRAQN